MNRDAILGIVFNPPSYSKPIGHASLWLDDADGLAQYDFDGASLLSAADHDVPAPRGSLILRAISGEDARRLRDHFTRLADPAMFRAENRLYFSMHLKPDPAFEARGRKPANCLTSLFHVMAGQRVPACMVAGLGLRVKHEPMQVMHALDHLAARGRLRADTNCFVENAGDGNWAGCVPGMNGGHVTIVTGLNGALYGPELMRADVVLACSDYRVGSLREVALRGSVVLPHTPYHPGGLYAA